LIYSFSRPHLLFRPALAVDTDDDYVVSLLSRQLGMTIENVLERTIVRSVHPNSEAFRLNVRTNSIILNIGSARFSLPQTASSSSLILLLSDGFQYAPSDSS
jgi:hypothetical protein